jgi:hypothetical protein
MATGVHTPASQVPPVQVEPSFRVGLEQLPVALSQVPGTWHSSIAVQTTGLPPSHEPPWQVSVWVQASPSSQAAPSGLTGFEHTPSVGSQVPAVWHWSSEVHVTGVLAPTQTPLWQVPPVVQPALQAVPLPWMDHAVSEVTGSQTRQVFAGFAAPLG